MPPSAETLRAAAAKARALADGVPAGPWEPGKDFGSVIAPEAECDSADALRWYGGVVIGESMSTPIGAALDRAPLKTTSWRTNRDTAEGDERA